MYFGKVEICGVNTAKLPVLSEEKKDALLQRIKQGDAEARTEFINGNLKLVLSVIQRFASRGENPDDLFQVGCIGLIKAIDNFDTSHGVRFSTYAVPMIIGEIRRYLRDNNAIRVSRSVKDTAYRALQANELLTRKLGRDPTVKELAAELDLPAEEIAEALDAMATPISLFEPVFCDGNDTVCVMDQIRDHKSSDENWLEEIALRQAIDSLSERERRILALRYYRGKTQMEVAEETGISQAQVSRLEKGALERMRKQL
ncbi:MAG: RNA polymerase sporulation sigma factor SigG [Clostridia bacterium]|nr:RNA polymerase sporulation sigma factor SigG [Clostridia bacterium]